MSLFIIKPLLTRVMVRCGHGELLMLFGILMTTAGYSSFEMVELKGDLGALVLGMLLATHPKASELADRLFDFKDLFLVGFFLNIGISGSPTLAGLVIALLLVLALPDPKASIFAIRQMAQRGYQGQITASVRYEDEIRILKEEGIDAAYSLYEEAGVGFADHVCDHMDYCKLQDAGLNS